MTHITRTTMYYDGGCPVCMRGVRHYQRLDWARRVCWVDMLARPDALRSHGVDFAAAMEHLHVRDRRGRLVSGAYAFAALWSELPWYRPLAWLMRLPGVLPVLDRLYRRMTRGRFRRRCAEGACDIAGPSA